MGIKLIMAGMIFLFNPSISIYDILPDVIGWALIYGGMYKLRDLAPTMEDAMVQLRRLIWLTAAQLGVMSLLPLMTDTGYALTFTFVFAIFECFLMILFMRDFTDGLQYIGVREESPTLTEALPNFRTINHIFPIIKSGLMILPELAYLSTSEYEGWITAIEQFDLANYPTLLRLLNILGVTIAGLVWLNIVLRYLNNVRLDKQLLDKCERYYIENVATQTDMLFCRSLKCGLMLFGAAFIFQFDIVLDGICLTPDLISAVLFFLGCVVMIRRAPELLPVRRLSVLYFIASAAAFALNLLIGVTFYGYGITRSIGGFYMFIAFIVIAAVAAALFVLMVYKFGGFVGYVVENHTGEIVTEEFRKTAERNANLKKMLRGQVTRFKVLAIISAVSSVLRYALMYAFAEYWMIDAVIQLVWLWFSVTAVMTLWEKVSERYGYGKRKE